MKKIKIMLTAVTVVAVVGGALAFKTHRLGEAEVCIEKTVGSGVCNTLIDADFGGAVQNSYYTTPGLNATTCSNNPDCNAKDFVEPE